MISASIPIPDNDSNPITSNPGMPSLQEVREYVDYANPCPISKL